MMKDGVEAIAVAGVNTALDTVLMLTAAGQPVKAAVESSRILTLQSVRDHLQQQLGNRNAAEITHTLASPPVPETSTASTPAPSTSPQLQTID